MATKTISVTEEAYDILKLRKEETESFSEVIVKLSGKKKLSSFAGVLSKKTADELGKEIARTRTLHRRLHGKRVENDLR